MRTLKPQDVATCIYCGLERGFTNEHVFPAGLGGDDDRFLLTNMVCGHCNTNIFSPIELQFMRSSPTALARIFLQPHGRGRGKKASLPTIDTRETTVLTENFGAVEGEVGTSGKAVILMQLVFLDDGRVGCTGSNAENPDDFFASLSATLTDSIDLIEKIGIGKSAKFIVETVRWTEAGYESGARYAAERPPVSGLWREVLHPSPSGKVCRPPTLYRRRAGQIVLRAPTGCDELALLTRARKALPALSVTTREEAAVVNPLVHLSMSMELSTYARVIAKIGVNAIAYAYGRDYARHHGFNGIKRAILTNKCAIPLSTKPSQDDPFSGVPADRHVVMVHFQKGRAGRYRVAVSARLYGGATTWVWLSEKAVAPPERAAILVVKYREHRIEEFNNLRQFVEAYPPKVPIEFIREQMVKLYPALPHGI